MSEGNFKSRLAKIAAEGSQIQLSRPTEQERIARAKKCVSEFIEPVLRDVKDALSVRPEIREIEIALKPAIERSGLNAVCAVLCFKKDGLTYSLDFTFGGHSKLVLWISDYAGEEGYDQREVLVDDVSRRVIEEECEQSISNLLSEWPKRKQRWAKQA